MLQPETIHAITTGKVVVLSRADVLRYLTDDQRNRSVNPAYVREVVPVDATCTMMRTMPIDDAAAWRCDLLVPVIGLDEPVSLVVDVTTQEWDAFTTRTRAAYGRHLAG